MSAADEARRGWLRALIWFVALVAVLTAGLWTFQRRLVYFPDTSRPDLESTLTGWIDTTVTSSDGVQLGAWYREPNPGEPVVIVFNGNAGNRSVRAPIGDRLASEGYGVVLFDYRGYGDSQGSPTEEGLELDARAAADFVAEHAPDHPVVYFGESLGAAVATGLAAERPPAILVLRSPFTSLADMARVHYPIIPARLILRDRYPTADHITSITAPLLVLAGSADTIVPLRHSRQVFEAARGPKELVVIEGADHNDWGLAGPPPLHAVVRFVTDHT